MPDLLHTFPRPRWQHFPYLPPNARRQPRPIAVRRHHDLQRPIAVDTPKIEITLRWDIGDVHRDLQRFTVLPDTAGSKRVVDGGQDHGDLLLGFEIERQEDAVGMGDVFVCDAIPDFGVQARGWADDGDMGIGVEQSENAAGGDLKVGLAGVDDGADWIEEVGKCLMTTILPR